jgi:hypothetical protein
VQLSTLQRILEFHVSKAQFILVALICVTPIILLRDGLAMQGLVAGGIGVALAIAAITLRPGETEFLISIIRPLLVFALLPILWIVFQILPLGIFAHPIWASTEATLGHTIAGTVSVDAGASVLSLGQYIALAGVTLLSAAIAIERGRAEVLLFTLTYAVTMIAVITLTHVWLLPYLRLSPFLRAQAAVCVAMGTIVASAACIRTVERFETRAARPRRRGSTLLLTFMGSSTALVVCATTLVLDGTRQEQEAAACGVALLVCITIIRRLQLQLWGIAIIAISLTGAVILLIAAQPSARGRSLLLSFAVSSPTSPPSVSERVLKDAPFAGTGAGTFAVVAPIYREMDDPPTDPVAATAAASLGIELGRPLLWLIVAAMGASIVFLLNCCLKRGRDSFYPAMGASCLATMLLLSFVNPGLLGDAAGLIAAITLGLAIAQSKSRTPAEVLANSRTPKRSTKIVFRLATLFIAVLIGLQSLWILLPELSRPGIAELPTDPVSAGSASVTSRRDAAIWAAQIGTIRGDLWAESAFTYADLLWDTSKDGAAMAPELQRARKSLYRTLDEAPEKSGAWLLLAGLALHYPSIARDPTAALKMSYYTGPTEKHLMSLRLRIAAQTDAFNDFEVRQFVSRDLHMFLAQHQEGVIAEAYHVASPTGKRFIENVVNEIDPSALDWLHDAAP